jgi:hypothetical protein
MTERGDGGGISKMALGGGLTPSFPTGGLGRFSLNLRNKLVLGKILSKIKEWGVLRNLLE